MVTLIGGSASGKTRSLYEFLRRLPAGWRLWHPYDPTRPHAALEHMAQVGPRTVIWLDDAHHYLYDPDTETAERITAGIRTLLRDPRRGPVLVLATLWPHLWEKVTASPEQGQPDRYAQQRELLTTIGHHRVVAEAFLPEEIDAAADSGDPRHAMAVRTARDGEITQLLTGIPDLMARHCTAPPPAASLIRAAQLYRRLGHGAALPAAMLTETALELLTDRQAAELTDDWAREALAYCTQPCRGVPGLLVRARGRRRVGQTDYVLNEALEETSRFSSDPVPEVFWQAAARHAAAEEQLRLAAVADRYYSADKPALLLAEAAATVLPQAGHAVAQMRAKMGDLRGAQEAYLELYDSGDTVALPGLVSLALIAGDQAGAWRIAQAAAGAGHANAIVIMAMDYSETDPDTARRLALIGGLGGDPRGFVVLGWIESAAGNEDLAREHYNAAVRLGLPPMGLLPADLDVAVLRVGHMLCATPINLHKALKE